MSTKKARVFKLPIKLILTEDGENFFLKNNKNMARLKLADGSSAYGIELKEFNLVTIQRLFQMDYISNIELASSSFSEYRHEIIDFSKLVMYSRFYKKFNERVMFNICNSDMVRSWNRANPMNTFTDNHSLRDDASKKNLVENADEIRQIQKSVMQPLNMQINNNPQLQADEKNIQLLFSEKLVQSMDSSVWLILHHYYQQKDFAEQLKKITDLVASFLKKSSIPEYFALMFMELLALTENTKLKNYARKELGQDYNVDQILADDAIRSMLVKKTSHENIFVSWKIKNQKALQSSGPEQMEVTIYDRDTRYRAMREKINLQKDLNLKEKTLTDFYSDTHHDGAGNELGLFYISYLDEACRKVDMRFESNVSLIGTDDLTMISLRIFI